MNSLGSMTLPARMDSLTAALSFLKTCAQRMDFDAKRSGEIELCLEEILVNIVHYAYPDATGDMEISCRQEQEGSLVIEVIDQGVPFDILSASQPDITATLDERRIGGLGIFFVKQLMDNVQYRRENGKNILTLTARKTVVNA